MSKDNHSFSVSVACEVGVPGAVILQHFLFLQKANVSDAENWQQKWVKRSAKSIAKTYPYWSGKQIASVTDSLEKGEYIFSKIENASKIDRTKSFILTAKGLLLMGEIPFAQMENGFSKTGNANAKMENAIPQNGKCNIEEDYTSFIPSLEEEKGALLSSSSAFEISNLEAEKKEKSLHRGAAAGGHLSGPFTPIGTIELPATVVQLHDPETPGATIYDQVNHKGYPQTEPAAEFHRVDIAQEVEAMRKDNAALEGFVIGCKIPRDRFQSYLTEFQADVSGRGEKYTQPKQLRLHFYNWSRARAEIENRKAQFAGPKQPGNNRSQINPAGGDLSKYNEPQIF